jgi:hypothetical protein
VRGERFVSCELRRVRDRYTVENCSIHSIGKNELSSSMEMARKKWIKYKSKQLKSMLASKSQKKKIDQFV